MSKRYYHPQTDFFAKRNLAVPSTVSHGTEDDISQKLQELKPNSWSLEGNQLIGETEMGRLVQFIPTDYILIGNENGLPKFRKVDIK